MLCPNCGRDVPTDAKFCPECGTKMPKPQAGPLVGDIGVIKGEQIIIGGPGAAPPAAPAGGYCEICGEWVKLEDSFKCRQCGRAFLHKTHRVAAWNMCEECAAPLAREAEDRERAAAEEEARRRAEEERQRDAAEEEARRRAEEERRRRELGVPEMITIPAGEFLMGSADSHSQAHSCERPQRWHHLDLDACEDEKPQHGVYLDEYAIGKYPVTNAEYAVFVQDSGHRAPNHWEGGRPPRGKERHPVVNVSWHDAVAYCRWLRQKTGQDWRLPTEAEWEKAARGTDGRIYPWGDDFDMMRCNTEEGGAGDTTPVGAYSPHGDSPYGCADMAGNVWEWVADWYDEKYYTSAPARNPTGPSSGTFRVVRGGSWGHPQDSARSAGRGGDTPAGVDNSLGFRCARGSPP